MDQPKPNEAELPTADNATPAKTFMESEEVEQKTALDKMSTVFDIEGLIPDDINSLNKSTTILVLEKTLNMCGVSSGTEKKTLQELQSDQDNLQLQIDAIKRRISENSWTLNKQRQVKNERDNLIREIENIGEHIVEAALMRNDQDEEDLRQQADRMYNQLDSLVFPLRND